MSKRIFILLIVLMSVALIGIIVVQVYWINNSIEIREKQFDNDVKFALAKVSENIQKREISDYYKRYKPLIDSATKTSKSIVKDFYFKQIDTATNREFTFRQSILENNYKSAIPLFNNDTIYFKTFFSEKLKETRKIPSINTRDLREVSPETRIYEIGKQSKITSLQFENQFKEMASSFPIYDRISETEIIQNIDNELRERGVDTKYEFAVYGDGLATKVKSEKFRKQRGKSYPVPLFVDDEGSSNYELIVSFPKKKEYILGSITNILILATIFILIITLAFASALYQLIKQKQISEIKTDFINNMTHEFKTPIATINLALDAIKNPKIIGDKEKILKYAEMIRQENKRMHGQVENVLRISKLEKKQLDLSTTVIDVHDIIEDAVSHVDLIIRDKGGYINTHFEALQSEVMANMFHLTNVFINLLDNAMKYTEEEPKIDVFTEIAGNNIIIKIKDQGIGMHRNVQKQVFEKFYREQKGNIHDVKGHGLGLSYVKKIVEHFHGSVYVESEKGKGSTFSVKLPLI